MKLLKKTLAMLLCLIMAVGVLPLSANAASSFTATLGYDSEFNTPGTVVISWSDCGFKPYKVRIYIGSELLKETTTSLYATEVRAIPISPYTVRAYYDEYDYIESEEVVLNADEFFYFTKTPKAVVKSGTPAGYVDVEFGVSFKPVGITIIKDHQYDYGSYKYGDRISVPISDKPYTIYVAYGNNNNATISYDFYALPDNTYSISVTNGTASKTTASEGEKITLTANAAPAGKVFDKWVVTGATVADATKATTTFTMPAANVTAKATYKDKSVTPPDEPALRPVTVVNGTTSSEYSAEGTTVYLTANQIDGKVFSHWEVNGATVSDANAKETTFTMGNADVTAEAIYDDCECKCHKGGIAGFFYKIVLFFQKLFGNNLVCNCGKKH